MERTLFILLTLSAILQACTRNRPEENIISHPDSVQILADTIIYDVNIVNKNPDDTWATQRLQKLDRNLMVNSIFEMIYSGKATAYNHTTGEKLTVRQVEELENTEGFKRENIDMVQFKEVWYVNTSDRTFTKNVISMVLGTQVYDSFGQFIANRAVMRVEL